jgi:hydroxymethylglutaryl-CoA lyase
MLAAVAERVELVEVAPRDGLQNEARVLPTAAKLELVERAYRAGARRIEVASFVRPDRVPQLADAEAVVAALPALRGARWSGLVLNERGYDRAVAAGLRELNTVVSATESFSQCNQSMGVADATAAVTRLRERAAADGVSLTVTVSVAFGCPFEGEVPVARLRETLAPLAGVDELALADTIGVAVPRDVAERFALAEGLAPLRAHFHDTRNTGVANALAAVAAGVRTLDASLAGIGGCPFAPAATGNVATEDVVYALERSGYETGLELDALIDAARWLADALGSAPPGMLARAGGFP